MDHISNLLTTIRNAELARHERTRARFSKLSEAVLAVLKQEGYVSGYAVTGDGAQRSIEITLAGPDVRHHYKRISKPGRRLYAGADKIPTVRRGLGMVVISTPQGVMSGKQARKRKIGGELICEVY